MSRKMRGRAAGDPARTAAELMIAPQAVGMASLFESLLDIKYAELRRERKRPDQSVSVFLPGPVVAPGTFRS